MNLLSIALLGNAIFSVTTGLALILFRHQIAHLFGKHNNTVFWIIGIGLLFFSSFVFSEVKTSNPQAVLFITVQDLLWVIASVVILLLNAFQLSALGKQLIAVVAFIVLVFGSLQAVGLAQVDNTGEQGMKRLVFERVVDASKEEAWKAVADVSNYDKVAPNIDKVEIISGEKEGMIRSCSHKTDSWTEVATLWEEGEQYSFQVNTEAEDYPYPLRHLQGTWQVEAVAENKTRITMIFDFVYERSFQNVLLHPFVRKQFVEIGGELLDNWQEELEQN